MTGMRTTRHGPPRFSSCRWTATKRIRPKPVMAPDGRAPGVNLEKTMSETPQSFDCKEPDCDSKVIYEPQSVLVYRGREEPQQTPPAVTSGRVVRVYLSCSRNHRNQYAVRV